MDIQIETAVAVRPGNSKGNTMAKNKKPQPEAPKQKKLTFAALPEDPEQDLVGVAQFNTDDAAKWLPAWMKWVNGASTTLDQFTTAELADIADEDIAVLVDARRGLMQASKTIMELLSTMEGVQEAIDGEVRKVNQALAKSLDVTPRKKSQAASDNRRVARSMKPQVQLAALRVLEGAKSPLKMVEILEGITGNYNLEVNKGTFQTQWLPEMKKELGWIGTQGENKRNMTYTITPAGKKAIPALVDAT